MIKLCAFSDEAGSNIQTQIDAMKRNGIYLTGGASQVSRFASLLHKGTGLKVNHTDKPLESVAIGLSKIIKDDNYKSLAYAIEGMGGK